MKTCSIVLMIMSIAVFAGGASAGAAVWGPTEQAPWPVAGRDVSHQRFVQGVPAVASPVEDYELGWIYDWYDNQAAEFVIADLDCNGNQEILLLHGKGYLAAIEAFEGPLWVHSDPDRGGTSWLYSVPAVGDLDGDQELEVVYGLPSGRVYQVDAQGRLEWQDRYDRMDARPIMVDLDGDGRYSTLMPTISYQPHQRSAMLAFSPTGELDGIGLINKGLAVDPFSVWFPDDTGVPHVLIAPFEGLPEEDDGCRTNCPPSPTGTRVSNLLVGAGASLVEAGENVPSPLLEVPNSLQFTGRALSGPILVDLDGDGREEVVLAMYPKQGYPGMDFTDPGQVVVLDQDLQIQDRYIPEDPIFRAAAVADIIPGGALELLLGTYAGLEILEWRQGGYHLAESLPVGTVEQIASADLDADGKPEIAVTVSYYYDDNRTGSVLLIEDDLSVRELIEAAGPHRSSGSFVYVAIADMDSDGSLDIVAYSYNGFLYVFSAPKGIGPELQDEALAAREEPGYVKEHEKLLMQSEPEVGPASAPHGFLTLGGIFIAAVPMALARASRRPWRV